MSQNLNHYDPEGLRVKWCCRGLLELFLTVGADFILGFLLVFLGVCGSGMTSDKYAT